MTEPTYLDLAAKLSAYDAVIVKEKLTAAGGLLQDVGAHIYGLYWPEPPPDGVITLCREAFHILGKLTDVVRSVEQATTTTAPKEPAP